nr:MAG TPA: hypothetical protein [Caudoviricetes sp.]
MKFHVLCIDVLRVLSVSYIDSFHNSEKIAKITLDILKLSRIM